MGIFRSGFVPARRERLARPHAASVEHGGGPEKQPTTNATAAQFPICLVDDFRLQFRPRFRQRVFGLAMVGLFYGVGGVEWQARRHTRG